MNKQAETGEPSDFHPRWQPWETLTLSEQRQRIVDSEYGGSEEQYQEAARAAYDKAREKLESSRSRYLDFPDDLYKQTFEYRAVEVGSQAEWSAQPNGPIQIIYTSPSRWAVGNLMLPTGTLEARVKLDEFGGGTDLIAIGTGKVDHPAVREVRLRLMDPNSHFVISPEQADLQAESLYY